MLKLSGEALAGSQGCGVDPVVTASLAKQIQDVVALRVQVAVVVGGGNFWRGQINAERGMHRATADYMGMLATMINSLALQDALEKIQVPTRLQTAIEMRQIAEPYIRRRAVRHLEKGRVVIFGGGIGSPFFSTDTTAALRAADIEADVILMAKHNIDGVYTVDPSRDPTARKYDMLTHRQILNQDLRVMDATASSLCMDNNIPLVVFDIARVGNIRRVVVGERIGTMIKGEVDHASH